MEQLMIEFKLLLIDILKRAQNPQEDIDKDPGQLFYAFEYIMHQASSLLGKYLTKLDVRFGKTDIDISYNFEEERPDDYSNKGLALFLYQTYSGIAQTGKNLRRIIIEYGNEDGVAFFVGEADKERQYPFDLKTPDTSKNIKVDFKVQGNPES